MKNVPASNYFRKSRVASRFKSAAPWVKGVSAPVQPTRMLSNVTVFDGWRCTSVAQFADQVISHKPSLTLRELQQILLDSLSKGEIEYPYVWWVYARTSRTRAIHEDAEGRPFVKLGTKWQLAYPLDAVAGLAGAQGTPDFDSENLPATGYFVLWENEDAARKHSL